jgi:hypothetical protein
LKKSGVAGGRVRCSIRSGNRGTADDGERRGGHDALFYEFWLERHVPSEHLLRLIDRFVDLKLPLNNRTRGSCYGWATAALASRLALRATACGGCDLDPTAVVVVVPSCGRRPAPKAFSVVCSTRVFPELVWRTVAQCLVRMQGVVMLEPRVELMQHAGPSGFELTRA